MLYDSHNNIFDTSKFEYLDEGYNASVVLSDESDNFKYIEA